MLKHRVVRTPYDVLPGSGVNLAQYEIFEYPNDDTVEFAFMEEFMGNM